MELLGLLWNSLLWKTRAAVWKEHPNSPTSATSLKVFWKTCNTCITCQEHKCIAIREVVFLICCMTKSYWSLCSFTIWHLCLRTVSYCMPWEGNCKSSAFDKIYFFHLAWSQTSFSALKKNLLKHSWKPHLITWSINEIIR